MVGLESLSLTEFSVCRSMFVSQARANVIAKRRQLQRALIQPNHFLIVNASLEQVNEDLTSSFRLKMKG